MKSICLICLALSLSISQSYSAPNIIVILADDQGFGDVSALNPESKIATSNIDRIAHESSPITFLPPLHKPGFGDENGSVGTFEAYRTGYSQHEAMASGGGSFPCFRFLPLLRVLGENLTQIAPSDSGNVRFSGNTDEIAIKPNGDCDIVKIMLYMVIMVIINQVSCLFPPLGAIP